MKKNVCILFITLVLLSSCYKYENPLDPLNIAVDTPTFSPPGGTYSSPQNVTISCTTAGASIRYTTDGTNPTESSALYSNPVTILSSTTLKAKAYKANIKPSSVATASYTIDVPSVATPTFSPSGGTYSSPQNVTISCTTAGASIRYTTDGTNPTESSALYSNPIAISSTTTLKAKAFKANFTPSSVATASYTINIPSVATPTFSPPGGTYSSPQNVTISCTTAGASIRYTTDGTNPTESSALYSNPITISSSTTLKAKAYKANFTPSSVATASYTINIPTVATPTFSPPGGTYSSPQNVTISCTTAGASIRYTKDGTNPTESSALYSGPITISSSTTLKAKAYKANFTPSSVATANYTINIPTVATPTFSPSGGSFTTAQNVIIHCTTAGASIRYTTNGTNPTESSALYSNPITISSTTTLKAKAYKNNFIPSSVATASYTIVPPLTVLYPNGGETLYRGSTYTITWHPGLTANWVEIELWKGNNPYWHPTIATFINNTGSFVWTIPSTTDIGNNYRIRIRNHYIGSNPGDEDYSDGYFTIQ